MALQTCIAVLVVTARTTKALNEYEMVHPSLWKSVTDFRPIPSSSYGSILFLGSLRMDFKLTLHNRTDYSIWQNIFRIGFPSTDNSCSGYGSRYPSLWLSPDADYLYLGISHKPMCYDFDASYQIQRDIDYSVLIEFNDTWMRMDVDGHSVISEARESHAVDILGQSLTVWISTDRTSELSDIVEDVNITLSAITILSWDSDETAAPSPDQRSTMQPALQPSDAPTGVECDLLRLP